MKKLVEEVQSCGGGFLRVTVAKITLWWVKYLLRCKKMNYNRAVPFGDILVDREEKARFLGFGKGSRIYDSSVVIGEVEVGENVWVGPFTVLDGSGGLYIGSYCSIGTGSQLSTHEGWRNMVFPDESEVKYSPVIMEDHCVLNPMVVVCPGVTIGHHSVIGACSLVNKDIPPYSKAFGVPCKVMGDTRVGN